MLPYNLNDIPASKPVGQVPFRFHLKSVPTAAQTDVTKTQRASITIPNTPATLAAKKIPLQMLRGLPPGRLVSRVGDRVKVSALVRVTASSGVGQTVVLHLEAPNASAVDRSLGTVAVGPAAANRLIKFEWEFVVVDPSTLTAAVVAPLVQGGPNNSAAMVYDNVAPATIDLSVDLVLKLKCQVGGTPTAESFVIIGADAEVFPVIDDSP